MQSHAYAYSSASMHGFYTAGRLTRAHNEHMRAYVDMHVWMNHVRFPILCSEVFLAVYCLETGLRHLSRCNGCLSRVSNYCYGYYCYYYYYY